MLGVGGKGGEGNGAMGARAFEILPWILFQPARVRQLDPACDRRCRWITFPTHSCNIWHTGVPLFASCSAERPASPRVGVGRAGGSPTLVAGQREKGVGWKVWLPPRTQGLN